MTNRDLQLPSGALLVPETQNLTTAKHWCEYGIWGLLFYDDQSPWLTLVECLHIAFDRKRKGEPLFDPKPRVPGGEHEIVRYAAPLNWHLRHLLFRDTELSALADSDVADEQMLWNRWLQGLADRKVTQKFDFLRAEFGSFRELARAVELLRTSEVESQNIKRWTSRHLLPLGLSMLFRDVREDGNSDRKFLRRTGELLYLMLGRSARSTEVAKLIDERLLAAPSTWDRLAQRLAGPDLGDLNESPIGYLPMPSHRIYDQLGDDWVSLLSLKNVPPENLLDSLQRISGLLQALFILERADETIADGVPIAPFFLDLVGAPGNNPIRKLSANQFKRHRALLPQAITSFLDTFEQSEEWQAVRVSDASAEEAASLLHRRFRRPPPDVSNPDRKPSADRQLSELRTDVLSSRSHSINAAFVNHTRQVGLLRSHRRSGTWYAPNDAFLEALVLTVVRGPMEFDDFLDEIWRRYHIAIGPEEVRAAFHLGSRALPAPLADLKENERRLEERLRVLGLLERKSDDCAFVINPLHAPAPATIRETALVTA